MAETIDRLCDIEFIQLAAAYKSLIDERNALRDRLEAARQAWADFDAAAAGTYEERIASRRLCIALDGDNS